MKNYNLPSWDLNTETNSRNFCNVKIEKNRSQIPISNENSAKVSKLRKKISKLLDSRKPNDEIGVPITKFYDVNLNENNDFNNNQTGYCITEILPKVGVNPKN